MSVLLDKGNGTFQTTQNFRAGSYVVGSVAVGDFNRDGWPDLAVAIAGTVSMLLNDNLIAFDVSRRIIK